MDLLRSIFIWLEGMIFLVVFFPFSFIIWLAVLPFDKRRVVIHTLIGWQCMLLVRIIPGLKLTINGKDNATKNVTYVIISNHLSLIDILAINTLGLRFKWVSKIENSRVPVLGWYLRMADYLTVDREDDESKSEMLARAYGFLKERTSVMMFPEGTRSADNNPGFFKRGAFQLAISAAVPILPLVIDGTGDILPKHGRIIRGNHRVKLKVLEPVFPGDFGTADPLELGRKLRTLVTSELEQMRKQK